MNDHTDEAGLERVPANHVPLSPLSFIARTARVYPGHTSVIYGNRVHTWAQTYERCRRLASRIHTLGIGQGDVVATMLPNVPAMVEAHFGVPMSGATLCTLNTRLDAESIAFMLRHSRTRLLLTDREFSPTMEKALDLLGADRPSWVIDVDDVFGTPGKPLGITEYETFLADGDPAFRWDLPSDEWDAIALNYTSGTTGNPKGVVYHHRGAYLNAVCNIVSWNMPPHPVYLWTLPMFHCNGWCFPWSLAANAGTHVCLRRFDPALVFEAIRAHKVTHLCGAPIVYAALASAPEALRFGITHTVEGLIAGAAPPAAVIEGAERAGFRLTHVYGLTEVYGPAALCAPQDEWADLDADQRAMLNARQGVRALMQEACEVLDPQTLAPVPWDGATIGEVCFRGNLVMKGYLGNDAATREAFAGGWFHTGDLAVVHEDGYIKIKDRAKDIIISGGENISSVELEDAIHRHPAVLAAAVVAMPDGKWGEVPCAFVELKPGSHAEEAELIDHCKGLLARFKVPKRVILGPLPKTATGKIQKFALREQMRSASAIG
jgi:fatty-acyl-CoA synthase